MIAFTPEQDARLRIIIREEISRAAAECAATECHAIIDRHRVSSASVAALLSGRGCAPGDIHRDQTQTNDGGSR
jgi:hypothetical protein